MIKQPLFGQDSSPHKTSSFMGGLITVFIWLVLTLTGVFVKLPSPAPKYKEVQIVLATTPIEEKTQAEESAAAAAAVTEEQTAVTEPVEVPEIPNPVETPVAQAKVEAPKANPAPAKTQTQTKSTPAPKTTTASKTTDPAKKVNFDDFQYATDYSEGVDFNNVSTKKQSFDWSQFDEPSEPAPQVSQKVDKVIGSSSMSGSAGETTTQKNQTQTSSKSNTSNQTPEASSTTRSAAESIKNATGSTTNNLNPSFTNNTQQFSSDLDITWNGGVARKQNGKLSINLDSVSSYIDEKKTIVRIEFTVDEKGYVIAGTIIIDRESILNKNVRDQIIAQISKWRFTEASTRSTASFEYTILKN